MKHFPLLALLVAQCAVASPPGLPPQAARTLRIGVVVDGPWERNGAVQELLRKEITDVLGTAVTAIFPPDAFLIGDWTLETARELNTRLLEDPQIDMVLGMGLITSQDLATRGPLPKPVIAPIIVDPDRQHVPMVNGTSGVKNLNYLVYPNTFVRDLKTFREILPIRRLVSISSKPYVDVLPPPSRTLKEIGADLGVEVTEMYVGFSADEVLAALPRNADAVFLQPSLSLPPREFNRLVEGFIERRLPSFSFFGEDEVRQGIMASANPDILPRLTRRMALNIQRILQGEEPGSLAVTLTPGERLSINMRTAYAVGVSPKWSTLLEAELIDVQMTRLGGLSLTFPDAVGKFGEENLDIQARIREVMAEENNTRIATASLLPSLDVGATALQIDKDRAEAGAMPERSGTLDLSAQLVLAEPALANVFVQSSLQSSREQDLEITRLNTVLDGSRLYMNYLRAKKIFFILLENLKLLRTNLEIARVRQATGAAGQEESLRWEVEIASLRKNAMAVQSQMNQALYGLKQVLNIPLLYVLDVSDVSLDDSSFLISNPELRTYFEDPLSFDLLSDFLTAEGARRAPELQQLDYVISAQERALTSTRLSYFIPTVSAFGKYSDRFYASETSSPFQIPPISSAPPPSTPGESFLYELLGSISPKLPGDQSWSVGVQLSLNLFRGFATTASEDRSSLILEQYRIQREALSQKVALRIRLEMEKAKVSYFAIQQSRLEQDAARKTLELVAESYSRGGVSILSLLDAQNSALRADVVAANAMYDFLLDYLSLQRAIGKMDILMTEEEREDVLQRLHTHMAAVQRK